MHKEVCREKGCINNKKIGKNLPPCGHVHDGHGVYACRESDKDRAGHGVGLTPAARVIMNVLAELLGVVHAPAPHVAVDKDGARVVVHGELDSAKVVGKGDEIQRGDRGRSDNVGAAVVPKDIVGVHAEAYDTSVREQA